MTLCCRGIFCTHVGVYALPHFPPESAAHPVDPVQWERVEWRVVCESVYICGRRSVGTYRELQAAITLATVYKYVDVHNSFFRWLVRGRGLGSVLTSIAELCCIPIMLLPYLPLHQLSSLWFVIDTETESDSRFTGC